MDQGATFFQTVGLSPDAWVLSDTARSATAFARVVPAVVTEAMLDGLAAFSTGQDANCRLCLHATADEPIHEMIIAQRAEQYFPPKKHPHSSKSFTVLRGRLAVFTFAEDGEVRTGVVLAPGETRSVRLPAGVFHVDIPVSPVSVHYEVNHGPAGVPEPVIMAPWGPGRADRGAVLAFRDRLIGGL